MLYGQECKGQKCTESLRAITQKYKTFHSSEMSDILKMKKTKCIKCNKKLSRFLKHLMDMLPDTLGLQLGAIRAVRTKKFQVYSVLWISVKVVNF